MQLKIDGFFAEKEIPGNDSVRLIEQIIEQIIEEMDISSLLSTYKRMGCPTATLPATMLKILVSKKIVERWTSRCRNWDCVLNQLEVIFSEREAG